MDCEKVQASSATTEAFIEALRRQHEAVAACNDRLGKVRDLEAERVRSR